MQISTLREARDYNRGLAAPIRWAHMAWALVTAALGPLVRWATVPARRAWAPPLLISLPLVLLLLPLDGPVARFFRANPLSGDPRRELEAIQQYGQGVCSLLLALVVWLQSPEHRRKLLNWVAAMGLAFLVVTAMKMLIGRPRPLFDDPGVFLGPFGQYPIGPGKGVHHAWEIWAGISSRLWSMPSSHTVYACVASVFLASIYPRLRVLLAALAFTVGLARVVTHAHYLTDVIAGAGLGLAAARTAVRGRWGERLADRLKARSPANPPAGDQGG
jgi:membrane-associated phospholipid phosphatase